MGDKALLACIMKAFSITWSPYVSVLLSKPIMWQWVGISCMRSPGETAFAVTPLIHAAPFGERKVLLGVCQEHIRTSFCGVCTQHVTLAVV